MKVGQYDNMLFNFKKSEQSFKSEQVLFLTILAKLNSSLEMFLIHLLLPPEQY